MVRPSGREGRLHIVAGPLADHAAVSTRGGRHADGPKLVVAPGGVDDGAAVAGPGRIQLEMVVLAGQAARLPGGQVADPQMAEGLEHGAAAVRRGRGPADHAHVELLGRHLDGAAQGVLHPAGVGDAERDVRHGAAVHVDAADVAARPEDDGLVVRGPADARIDPVDGPGFLQVAVQPVMDRRSRGRTRCPSDTGSTGTGPAG